MDISNRAIYRGQVTKLSKNATDYLQSPESRAVEENAGNFDIIEEELNVLLQRLTAARDNLNKANSKIRSHIKPEDIEKECESVAEYEDKAIAVIARINQRLAKLREVQGKRTMALNFGNQTVADHKGDCIKLPKLALKKFSGNCHEWLPFWEQFRCAVHENRQLNGTEKFHYLQSVLIGKAAETIAGFTPSEACYDGAIALLVDEYGSTEKLVDRNMQILMSIASVTSSSDVTGLRRLYNSVVSCTRSLTALGVPSTHYYIMLKSILLKCMPSDLRVDFYRTYQKSNEKESDAPAGDVESVADSGSSVGFDGDRQVKALLKFLKREVESLEKASESKRPYTYTSTKFNRTASALLTANSRDMPEECLFCKSSSHTSKTCNGTLSLLQRKEILKQTGRCFRCTQRGHSSRFCNSKLRCEICNGRHAMSMCDPNYKQKVSSAKASLQFIKNSGESTSTKTINLCSSAYQPTRIYLQTACAFISSTANSSNSAFIRLVLDGGAQRSYIRTSIARKLDLVVVGTENLRILPFGSRGQPPVQKCNRVRVALQSQYDCNRRTFIEAIEIEDICVDVLPIPMADSFEFSQFDLADARVTGDPEDGISLLIGSDYYWKLVYDENRQLSSSLRAINTFFGWTVQGPVTNIDDVCMFQETSSLHVCCFDQFEEKRFWDLDTIGISAETYENCESSEFYDHVYKRHERYEAKLLWRQEDLKLDSYREGAMKRFTSLVKKLSRNPVELLRYDEAMRDYISNSVAEAVNSSEECESPIYYLAHHPVYREDKLTTKLRIVFDASARTGNNASLNDCLLSGPNMLPDIVTVLLNFRIGKIGVIADVERAFLQIALAEKDRNVHRFYWFADSLDSPNNLPSIQEYRMTRVTFGVKCSPFLLAATIRKHLKETYAELPETSAILQRSFYMDDLVVGVPDRPTALRLYKEASVIMQGASMTLRKWNSNDPTVRSSLIEREVFSPTQKVLGLLWFTSSDELAVDLSSTHDFLTTHFMKGTKRTVLQLIARIYDPLGMLGPFVIKLKILFQQIWKIKLDWDAVLPEDLLRIYNNCCADFPHLKDIILSRCVLDTRRARSTQLHIFADASLQAYGAAAYLRSIEEDGRISVKYLCSRNRVAPLKESGCKELTLPKLELTAALISARLKFYLEENLQVSFDSCILWSDSKIVLSWINGDIKKWKPYVAHRVKEIREKSEPSNWRHCPGTENPADLLTRGIDGRALANTFTWTDGPDWLKTNEGNWPNEQTKFNIPGFLTCLLCTNENAVHEVKEPILPIENHSRYRRLLRITAYVMRFSGLSKERGHLKANELRRAENYWIKNIQEHEYSEEISDLLRSSKIKPSSSLLTLNPVMDESGMLRVGSRIQNMRDDFTSAFPVILPRNSHLTKLIVTDVHERMLHGGVNLVLSRLREKFWVPRGRQLIKTVVKTCRVCKKIRGKPAMQTFSSLPRERLHASRPFETVGIDFAGPLYVKKSSADEETCKAYIMLLTCAVVRAIHLELVSSLSTENCLLALRRFISRRGIPSLIISDNAATFKRASLELKDLGNILKSEELQGYVSSQGIRWKFIVERAPWWGGFWERLVRSVKEVLRTTIGKAVLTTEQLRTLLTEVEAVINCRPLTYISSDPLDLSPLTPQHILTGLSSTAIITEAKGSTTNNVRQLWKARLRMTNVFWKRWKLEYLHQLRSAHHHAGTPSSNLKIGDVVIVNEHSTPRTLWRLAIIESIFPGRDGKVRACEVRFHNGVKLRRPVQLLYPLESNDDTTNNLGPEDVENFSGTHTN